MRCLRYDAPTSRRRSEAPDSADLERMIGRATGVPRVELGERVQELWGGYGEIRRARLGGVDAPVIVKHVVPPSRAPKASEALSHRRKLRSYEVECAFYRSYAPRCGASARVPSALHAGVAGERMLLVLEDLDASGFAERRSRVADDELSACLAWLAHFHARFLGVPPAALWKVGTYWHLATRPDELEALGDVPLGRAAAALDQRLNRARFRTLVHGDAKIQNFCFSTRAGAVAAVDFQYVGGGPGIKDVAYFLTSCLAPRDLLRDAEHHLDAYFSELRAALQARDVIEVSGAAAVIDVNDLEAEWRELYPIACADFYRFLLGWAGEGGARDAYLERVTAEVLK